LIELFDKSWQALSDASKRLGNMGRLDILTGYIGADAANALASLGSPATRIVFGLDKRHPALRADQIAELRRLAKVADLRIYPGLHAKCYLFEDRYLALGSANFTRKGFEVGIEALIVTDDRRALKAARQLFTRVWKAASEVPVDIRVLPSGAEHESGKQSALPRHSVTPFSHAQSRVQAGRRRVRLCAFPAHWLQDPRGFANSRNARRLEWSTGERLQKDDIQVFCVMRSLSDSPELIGDPRLDAVHSLWRAQHDAQRLAGHEWSPQGREQ
jgi:PLD-like domain